MPYKVEPSQRITRLQRSLEAKLRALQALEQERAELHFKHVLLSSTCEVLSILRHRKAALAGADSLEQQTDLVPNEELQHLNSLTQLDSISSLSIDSLEPSQDLQSQLMHAISHSSNSSDTPTLANCLQRSNSSEASADGSWCTERELCSTIAPDDDPLQFLRGLMLQPYLGHGVGCGLFGQHPVPHPAVITLEELQSYYYNNMNQLATHVGFLEQANCLTDLAVDGSSGSSNSSIPAAVMQHAEAVKQILFRYLLLINDIVLHGNMNVLVPFYINNVVTNAEPDHKTDMYLESLQQMNVTQQQQDSMLACFDFYVRLYGLITGQRAQMQQKDRQQQQQQQQHDEQEWETGSSSGSGTGMQLNQSSSGSTPFEVQKSVQQQQKQNWQQQQRRQQYLQTMDVNMGKELMIVHLVAFTFWGSLTWLQAAKLIITCYPFAANPIVLVAEIKEIRRRQQQQQAEQQQQQRKGRNGYSKRSS